MTQITYAQYTVTIPSTNINTTGLTNAERRKPFGSFFGYERSAFIYKHSEINEYGLITAISFYCDSLNLPDTTPVVIYMKEEPDSAFSNAILSTVAEEEAGALMVFSGTLLPSSFVKGQWTTITLNSPFQHLSSQPVEIIVETNAGGAGNEVSLAKSFYHYTNYMITYRCWTADNAPPTGLCIDNSFNRPNIKITMTAATACSGTPAAGITISSSDTICALSSVLLSLNGNSNETNLQYQWQDSLSGGIWTNLPYANYPNLSDTLSVNTWFRCKVSCGTNFSYSTVKSVQIRNYMQCYCFSNLGGGCTSYTVTYYTAIDSVALSGTGLLTSHTGCSVNNYTLYPAQAGTSAQVVQGQTYNLHTRFNGNVVASVWVDYNQNGAFEHSEWKQISLDTKIDSDYVTALTIPSSAPSGLTIMRIRSRYTGDSNDSLDACINFSSGETEDYYLGVNYAVGIQKANTKAAFSIYPNPAGDKLKVWVLNYHSPEEVSIGIYNLNGEKILTENLLSGENFSELDITGIPEGIYFVRVEQLKNAQVKKLVIIR